MKWSIGKEKQKGVERYVVRRWKDGKLERMPVKKYRRIREDFAALEEFVKRENAPIVLREKVEYKHAFINDSLLEDYRVHLGNSISGEGLVSTELSYIKHYFLHFFLTVHNSINPADWIVLESKWISYLLNDPSGPKHLSLKGIKAETTKRKVISAANRFMVWLHKRRPKEVPKIQFETIAKAKFKDIKERRRLDSETADHTYIPKEHMNVILEAPPKNLEPFVNLMAKYGLRRNEALGVLPGDIKKGVFVVDRQLKRAGRRKPSDEAGKPPKTRKWGPLKGKAQRKVPHWFCTPAEAHKWVQQAQEHIVSPRELHERLEAYMTQLGYTYTSHDFKHTWTTNAARVKVNGGPMVPRDLQLAAGHKSLATTMQYFHDDRDDSEEDFVPDEAA